MRKMVKFALMGDPHFEMTPNGDELLEQFLNKAREENVDFIIHLGDFSYPTNTYKNFCPIEKMPVNVKNAYNKPRNQETLALLEKYRDKNIFTFNCTIIRISSVMIIQVVLFYQSS